MKPRLLVLAAALATPAYLLLDGARLLPAPFRDRPWPLALLAVVLALAAARRLRTIALVIAFASPLALGLAAHLRYRLPPSSATAPLPQVQLRDQSGAPVALRGPMLLVWFRGSWCPFCRAQLAEIRDELRAFSRDQVRVFAVSAEPPESLAKLDRELGLGFTLLSDPDRRLVARCELAHCVAILDGSGAVRWQAAAGNWRDDLPARALVQAAWRLR